MQMISMRCWRNKPRAFTLRLSQRLRRASWGPSRYWLLMMTLLATTQLTGCATIEPWVKPYEREKLADPIMAFGRHPVAIQHQAHVRDSREAAKGANGSGGGGCGCN